MPTVVHTVGIADLGLRKGADVSTVLRELGDANVETKRQILIDARRSEPEHAAMSPLESLLTHVQFALTDDDAVRRWELILVVTEQDPPDRNDTRSVGQAIVDVLQLDPAAFGHPVRPHMVVVSDMSAEAFADAVMNYATTSFMPQPVIVGIAGGPAIASLGVLGGLLNAGVKPSLIEANRQDLGFDVDVSLVKIDPDVRRALARSRQYAALAPEFAGPENQDQRALCRVLDAAVNGEWEATEPNHSFRDTELRRSARSLAAPHNNGALRRPRDRADGETWGAWATSLRRMIIHRVANDDELALAMTDSFLHATINAQLNQYSADIRRCADLISTQKVAKAISLRITKRRWGPDFEAVLRDRGKLSVEDITQKLANLIAENMQSSVAAILANQDLTAYEVVFDQYFRDHPEELPESVRPIVSGVWREIYDTVGVSGRHGLGGDELDSLRKVLIKAGITEDEEESRAVRLLGLRPAAPLGAQGRVAIMCVGQSHDPTDDPMLSAVLDHLAQSSDVQLLLVTSGGERGTLGAAKLLQEQAEARIPGRCQLVMCDDSFGVDSVRRDLRLAFEALDLDEIRLVQIFAGPGTKAQNIGVAIGGVEASLELAAQFQLHTLSPVRTSDGSLDMSRTKVSPAVSASKGWRRIMPDEQIERICTAGLERADVDVWRTIEWISGSSWDGIVSDLRELARFVETSLKESRDDRRPIRPSRAIPLMSREQLVASRVQLIWKLRSAAPRTTAARAALTISDAFDDETEDAWQRRGPASTILWGNRIAVLREPWTSLRDLPPLAEILSELALPTLNPWPLSDLVDRIERDIEVLRNASVEIDLVNMTPHPVVVIPEEGPPVEIPVCGVAPRAVLERADLSPLTYAGQNIPFGTSRLRSQVSDIPDPDPRYMFIVSRMVAEALPDREDLVFPDQMVRNEHDVVIGCRRLSRIVKDSLEVD